MRGAGRGEGRPNPGGESPKDAGQPGGRAWRGGVLLGDLPEDSRDGRRIVTPASGIPRQNDAPDGPVLESQPESGDCSGDVPPPRRNSLDRGFGLPEVSQPRAEPPRCVERWAQAENGGQLRLAVEQSFLLQPAADARCG